MKVLILSCNTGEGHNSCAAALEEECRNQNIPCDTEDALRFISPEVSRFISNWHVRIYRHAPGLFRVGYRAAEDHPAQFHEGSALYRYLTQGAEKLCGFIAGSGYDTVICTHTFAALMVSEVVKTHLPITAVKVTGKADFLPLEMLCAWLRLKLGVPVETEFVPDAQAVTGVYLTREDGVISLERPYEDQALISLPGQTPQEVSVPMRTIEDCLTEELRRIDPDEIYAEVINEGWDLIRH